ncbi:DUF3306 domain-containing protein [soil metagenome]
MAEDRPGFLGRWARRKTDALQGRPLEEPAAPVETAPVAGVAAQTAPVKAVSADAPPPVIPAPEAPENLLSLDDVKGLTRESDFRPFMARDVAGDVRNAAMKKLFTDPHYNVMDGLDIYIDDYSIADPIPASMLRQMVGAKLLKIFDEEEGEDDKADAADVKGRQAAVAPAPAAPLPPDDLNNPTPESVAQSGASPDDPVPKPLSPENSSQPEPDPRSGASQDHHAHSHLRLQPDHASPAPSAGHGTS